MLGRTHLVAGAIAGAAVAARYGPRDLLGLALGAAIGMASASLADIDLASARLSRALPGGRWPSRLLPHRGPTHSLLAVAVYSALWAGWLAPTLHLGPGDVAAAAAGYASHLVLDGCSGGVAWLWPFSGRHLGLRWVRTGGRLERRLIYPGLLLLLLWCAWRWR
jgi:membrane-bound metal-dependent hydrolase YbcI (DUF457 family)